MLAFLLANLLKGLNVIIQAPEGPTLLTPLSESPAQLGQSALSSCSLA